jgi:TusE/DsrC/DsvC family sulfur relay protein
VDRGVGRTIRANIGIELTDRHWEVIRWLRDDYRQQGETATLRRVTTVGGIPTKDLFALFPKKPAKKMAYISGLPKPVGCV